jgi:uncharacterized membrane protein
MLLLTIGVVLFAAAHAVPMFPAFRARLAGAIGDGGVKGVVALGVGIGFALMIWGYGTAREEAVVVLWDPPVWTRHLAVLLMLPAFIMLAAAYTPPGRLKAALKHPMLASVKLWALAHLLANGTLADLVLFGGLLAWAVADRISLARRERAGLVQRPVAGPVANDLIAVAVGTAIWAALTFGGHAYLFGVSPLG